MAWQHSTLGTAAWFIEDPAIWVQCNGIIQTSGEEDEVNP